MLKAQHSVSCLLPLCPKAHTERTTHLAGKQCRFNTTSKPSLNANYKDLKWLHTFPSRNEKSQTKWLERKNSNSRHLPEDTSHFPLLHPSKHQTYSGTTASAQKRASAQEECLRCTAVAGWHSPSEGPCKTLSTSPVPLSLYSYLPIFIYLIV